MGQHHKSLTRDKFYAQRRHAAYRAKTRYQLAWNGDMRRLFESAIRENNSILIERQSVRVSIHVVKYDGVFIPVVYDGNRHNVVSLLPLQYLRDQGYDPVTMEKISKPIYLDNPTNEPLLSVKKINKRIKELIWNDAYLGRMVKIKFEDADLWFATDQYNNLLNPLGYEDSVELKQWFWDNRKIILTGETDFEYDVIEGETR